MKTIGIIGGMGPEATADLFLKIIRNTKAEKYQAHVPVLIDSNTAIADRTAAILTGAPSPLPELIKSAKRLEAAGAKYLMMACNTAHCFYNDVQAAVNVPLLHMPRETAKAVAASGKKKAALLSTTGTVQTGVYRDAFCTGAPEVELLLPDEDGQNAVMDMIYQGVKAGLPTFDISRVQRAVDALRERGAETFVLGCTELPLAITRYGVSLNATDPTLILARAAIKVAGGELIA